MIPKDNQEQDICAWFVGLERIALSFKLTQGKLYYLDQRLLPFEEIWVEAQTYEQTEQAIKCLAIRGAPLIGVAAAMSLARHSVQTLLTEASPLQKLESILSAARTLRKSRPTAINLMNAIDQSLKAFLQPFEQNHLEALIQQEEFSELISKFENKDAQKQVEQLNQSVSNLVSNALQQFDEDVRACDRMAQKGAELICEGDGILTICNTGGLATVGGGTALNVIKKAAEQKKKIQVYACETRPLLQGGRLTSWELNQAEVPFTLICDSMAGFLMAQKKVQKIFIGADRITRSKDAVNKIGSYSLAVLANYHQIPFYVVAPQSTFSEDLSAAEIPIEQRAQEEVLGKNWKLKWGQAWNPAFDIVPSHLITGIITDSDF